ncbi:MAG: excalibur domain-containing protein [Actinomycetota bacterium]|nr:excalibur domain-containing protein [Actinomycetota bacterium]
MRRTVVTALATLALLVLGGALGAQASSHSPAAHQKHCTKGYSPCLRNLHGADYDCYGGSGNGPYYTKSGVAYRVTGSDPYDLDSNNNGQGCE